MNFFWTRKFRVQKNVDYCFSKIFDFQKKSKIFKKVWVYTPKKNTGTQPMLLYKKKLPLNNSVQKILHTPTHLLFFLSMKIFKFSGYLRTPWKPRKSQFSAQSDRAPKNGAGYNSQTSPSAWSSNHRLHMTSYMNSKHCTPAPPSFGTDPPAPENPKIPYARKNTPKKFRRFAAILPPNPQKKSPAALL